MQLFATAFLVTVLAFMYSCTRATPKKEVDTENIEVVSTTTDLDTIVETPPAISFTLAGKSELLNDAPLIFSFSEEMDPSTLVISGDFGDATYTSTWSNGSTNNDTLTVQSNDWGIGTSKTLTINVKSSSGVSIEELSQEFLIRNNVYGSGLDGDITLTSVIFTSDEAELGRRFSAHRRITSRTDKTITLHASFGEGDFDEGDELLWIVTAAGPASSCSNSRGQYGFVKVASTDISNNKLTTDSLLDFVGTPNSGVFADTDFCVVQIYRVPNFISLNIDAARLKAEAFDGNSGGIIVFRVQENLSLNGSGTKLIAFNAGFRGGSIGSVDGMGIAGLTANSTAGPGHSGANFAGGGGNRGHGSNGAGAGQGQWGEQNLECGGALCAAEDRLFFGGGGGGSVDEAGGNGGGIILVIARNIQITTPTGYRMSASGDGTSGDGTDAGGGGAGGTIFLRTHNPGDSTFAFTVSAQGGEGDGDGGNRCGFGGGGYIQFNYCSTEPENTGFNAILPIPNGNSDGPGSYAGESVVNPGTSSCANY